MSQMKVIACQEHGGTFRIPVRRGRPPSRCTPENQCDMVKKRRADSVAKRTAETLKGKMPSPAQRTTVRGVPRKASAKSRETQAVDSMNVDKAARVGAQKASKASAVTVRHNPSIVLAKRARDLLEPQGWNLKGRQWTDEHDSAWAEVTGTRGEETIVIRWQDGKFFSQDYSLWDADKTAGQNGKPKSRLPFDPDEMSDAELAAELSGRTVTWWNRLAQSNETAVIGNKLKIEHTYTGGNETARQVHFVDATPNHAAFRAFNVDALMKVK